jgi:hypothetical protein
MNLQISFIRLLKSGLKYFLIFGLPLLADRFIDLCPIISNMSLADVITSLIDSVYPSLSTLTIGSIIVMILKYAKVKAEILGRIRKNEK